MATSVSTGPNDERRSQVMLGDLPGDFLRVAVNQQQRQIDADLQAAQMLQAQQQGYSFVSPSMAKLSITIVQAKLTKNYGLVKMDPYCRIRVGHSVFETQTAVSGAKNPRWNKTVYTYIPQGVDTIYLEVFDEHAFTMDDRVAWTHVTIPQQVFNGETSDDWYVLNGKQGDGKEGMVNMVLSYTPASEVPQQPQTQIIYTTPYQPPVTMVPGIPGVAGIPGAQVYYPPAFGAPGPVPVQQYPPQQPPGGPYPGGQHPQQLPPQPQEPIGPPFTDEDVTQVKDMFPDVDDEVIRSLLEVNQGNKDATINNLLQMNS